ncbi:MAG: TonB-dependent receptor, partial [Bryobacteraceae bacterium]
YEQSNGNSVYHGATFQLMRRFRSGLGGRLSYTYSKSIDDAGTGGRAVVAQNYLDLTAERALSNFDQRHNLSLNWHYSSGMGMRGGAMMQGWKAKLLRDWMFMNTLTLRSGTPLTATAGGTRSVTGGTGVSGSVRADATGLPIDATSTSPYFNTAAFTQPAAGSWGDAGRNTIPGPTTFSLNASLGRSFPVGERRNIELRMEATNLLNRVTITSFGTTVGSSIFGIANSAAAMRQMSASLRFRF